MSSVPASSHTGRRKKQPKSCRLVRLPQHLLRRIFEHVDTLDFGALTLCRALHPFVLGALYRSLHLVTERDLRRFACALRRHPERGLLPRNVHAPSEDIFIGVGLFKDILLRLRNLNALAVNGGQLASRLFSAELTAEPEYPRLSEIWVSAYCGETVGTRELSPALCRDLSHLPTLKALSLVGLSGWMPANLLNMNATDYLPPRSLRLKSICINGISLKIEIRLLFQALADGLRYVQLESEIAWASIMEHLALIPPSVEHLKLSLGLGACENNSSKYSKMAHKRFLMAELNPGRLISATSLPAALRDLSLQGDLVGPETFDVLLALPSLDTLALGSHTRFSSSDLIAFIESSPTLKGLIVNVCQCAVARGGITGGGASARRNKRTPDSPKPVWRDGFRLDDAQAVFLACQEKKIGIGGTIVCASKLLPRGVEGHDCRGWCGS